MHQPESGWQSTNCSVAGNHIGLCHARAKEAITDITLTRRKRTLAAAPKIQDVGVTRIAQHSALPSEHGTLSNEGGCGVEIAWELNDNKPVDLPCRTPPAYWKETEQGSAGRLDSGRRTVN